MSVFDGFHSFLKKTLKYSNTLNMCRQFILIAMIVVEHVYLLLEVRIQLPIVAIFVNNK